MAENYEELKQHRVFSAMVPAELGGGGRTHSEMCRFLRLIGSYCSSTGLAVSMHQHLVAAAIFNHRNGKPGAKLLEAVAADEKVLLSTGAGDWLSSKGSMTRVEGGFRVNARKGFGSGAPAASIFVTSAPYEDPEESWQVLHFPVPASAEGVRLDTDWQALGMRGTGSNAVVFEDVFVPDEAIALRRPQGAYHGVWNVILTVALPLIASPYVGMAEAADRIVREMVAKRDYDPLTAILLGEMTNQLTIAQIALDDMIRLANDLDFEASVETANAILTRKTIAVDAAQRAIQKAMEATSGAGFYRRMGIEKLVRDSYAGQFHPLPEKKQQLFTGRLAMGLDPVEVAN